MRKRIILVLVFLCILVFSTIWYCIFDDVLWWRIVIAYGIFLIGTILYMNDDLALRISFFISLKKYKRENVNDLWAFIIKLITVLLISIGSIYLIAYSGTLFKK